MTKEHEEPRSFYKKQHEFKFIDLEHTDSDLLNKYFITTIPCGDHTGYLFLNTEKQAGVAVNPIMMHPHIPDMIVPWQIARAGKGGKRKSIYPDISTEEYARLLRQELGIISYIEAMLEKIEALPGNALHGV